MVDEGEPRRYEAAYDDPAVRETFPMADLIRESIADGGPRPLTPYYVDVAGLGDPDLAPAGRGQRRDAGARRTDSWPTSWAEGDCCDARSTSPAALLPSHRQDAVSGRVRGERRLGLWLTLPSFIVMILVTAYPLVYALVLSLFNYRLTDPAGTHVRRAAQLRGDPDRPGVVERLRDHAAHHRGHAWRSSWCSGFALRVRDATASSAAAAWCAPAILIPYGIITVVSAFIWRYAFAIDSGLRQPVVRALGRLQLVRRPLVVAVRHLPVRDLEDHAVHLAAPAGRAGAGARGPAGGGQGRRRHGLAAAVEGDPAEHEGGDHGRAAVPDARRVADLRQPVRHDRRRQQHRDGLVPGLPPERHAGEPRAGLGGLGAAVPHRGGDRVVFVKGFKTDLSQVEGGR